MPEDRQPLTILHAALSLDLSGQTVHIRNLCSGLNQTGHRTLLAAGRLERGEYHGAEYVEKIGTDVLKIPLPDIVNRLCFAMNSIRAGWALASIIRQQKADILHVHAVTLMPAAKIAKHLCGGDLRIVSSFHNQSIAPRKKRFGQFAARVFTDPFGDCVFATSSEMRDQIVADYNVHETTMVRILYAVDDSLFNIADEIKQIRARTAYGVGKDDFVVSCVARLEPRKNQACLLKACAIAKKQVPGLALILAGKNVDGYREQLVALATELGIRDAVSMPGVTDSRDVYHASDLHVLPSRLEGFGMVVVEAGLCGVPSIRSKSAGAVEQIEEGVTGFTFDDDDFEKLAEHIIYLANNRDVLKQMGTAAAESYKMKFTTATMTRQVLEAYQAVLQKEG